MMNVVIGLLAFVSLSSFHQHGDDVVNAFVVKPTNPSTHPRLVTSSSTLLRTSSSSSLASSFNENDIEKKDRLDIVLFGIGDLRTNDHAGLQAALSAHQQPNQQQEEEEGNVYKNVLPIFILDEKSVTHLPGAVSHTKDTAAMISHALNDLSKSLQKRWGLQLKVVLANQQDNNNHQGAIPQTLTKYFQQQQEESLANNNDVHVHVCDLDPIDNEMGYGPYSQFIQENNNNNSFQLHPWNCHLRSQPWNSIIQQQKQNDASAVFPDSYPEYIKQFNIQKQESFSLEPLKMPPNNLPTNDIVENNDNIPTPDIISDFIIQTFNLDPQQCQQETSTGLYGTHWANSAVNNNDKNTVSEQNVWKTLMAYCNVMTTTNNNQDTDNWNQSPYCPWLNNVQNPKSLEHSSMTWLTSSDECKLQNLIEGETMTRFLAAPLFLGTISPRTIWHMANNITSLANGNNNNDGGMSWITPSAEIMLKRLVEGREWHKLLAASQRSQANENQCDIGYWRWHGFLCRYIKRNFDTTTTSVKQQQNNRGILWVHGFGASGSQWEKSINVMETTFDKFKNDKEQYSLPSSCLAPDLIGFGQSEKPPLTYTQYLWSGFVSDFIKEIAFQNNLDSLVVGGNSIGGFLSLQATADDHASDNNEDGDVVVVSSLGAPGTGRIDGQVLFNSAGRIPSMEQQNNNNKNEQGDKRTMAQKQANNGLPSASPPIRWISRLFGEGLLAYLRPNIVNICEKVYPIRPSSVTASNSDVNLADMILRDSLDPGAIHVMMSGSKLPPPRTLNELLGANDIDYNAADGVQEGKFMGPVLVAQGYFDPLNDAKGRAEALGAMRDGITVRPINGGHCPHDEVPEETMNLFIKWYMDQFAMTNEQEETAARTLTPVSTGTTSTSSINKAMAS